MRDFLNFFKQKNLLGVVPFNDDDLCCSSSDDDDDEQDVQIAVQALRRELVPNIRSAHLNGASPSKICLKKFNSFTKSYRTIIILLRLVPFNWCPQLTRHRW